MAGNFGIGALYIYKNFPDYQNITLTDNVRSADYVPVTFTANCGNTTCWPWQEIGLSGFFNARQGYPFNRVIQSPTRRGGIGRANVDIDRWGEVRLENHYQLDLRVDKQFPIGRTRWTAALDLFKVFNAATVLDRQEIQNTPTANFVEEVLAPRVARFSVRLQF